MDIRKIDENQIEVTKTENKVETNTFTYEYLISQREAIQKMKDGDNTKRDEELAEIDTLLAECNKIGVTFKPEPIIEPIGEPVAEPVKELVVEEPILEVIR